MKTTRRQFIRKRGFALASSALLSQLPMNMMAAAFKAEDFFRKYPGRFISAHLADFSPGLEKQVPIGQGMVDWEDLFEAAKTGGVQNYVVEMEAATFEESANFLSKR